MKTVTKTKYIHEGPTAAAVEVDSIIEGDAWVPYLSLQDAYRLDDVRNALRSGDLDAASDKARVFTMRPLAMVGSTIRQRQGIQNGITFKTGISA